MTDTKDAKIVIDMAGMPEPSPEFISAIAPIFETMAIKEITEKNDALRAENAALRAQIAEAEARGRIAGLNEAADLYNVSALDGGVAKSPAFFIEMAEHKVFREACAGYRAAILALIGGASPVSVGIKPLEWDRDGRKLRMDETMQFSKSYDWQGYECFRQEGYGIGADYIIWPEGIVSNSWSVYGTFDGLYIQSVNGEEAAKAAAQADFDAKVRARLIGDAT